jgi:hypothetical protein
MMRAPLILPLSPDFASRWAAWYGATPPIGFLLREKYPDRWLRIHSLRSAARYPRSGWDYAELVRRHNTIANHVLGLGAESAFLLFRECSEGPPPSSIWGGDVEDKNGLSNLGPIPETYWQEELGIFAAPICLFGGLVKWEPGQFDGFIIAVAMNEIRGLIVELERGHVYAPYDGGADLFFATAVERDIARGRYHAWLSPHSEGL